VVAPLLGGALVSHPLSHTAAWTGGLFRVRHPGVRSRHDAGV